MNSVAFSKISSENTLEPSSSVSSDADLLHHPHHQHHPSMSMQTGFARQMGSKSPSPVYTISYGSMNEVRASSALSTPSHSRQNLSPTSAQTSAASTAADYQESRKGTVHTPGKSWQVRNSTSRERDISRAAQVISSHPSDNFNATEAATELAATAGHLSSSPNFLHTIHDVQNKLDDLARLIDTTNQVTDVHWFKDAKPIRAEPTREMLLEGAGGDLCTLLILECSQLPAGGHLSTCNCYADHNNHQQTAQLTSIDSHSGSERMNYQRTSSRTPDYTTSYSTSTSHTMANHYPAIDSSLSAASLRQQELTQEAFDSGDADQSKRNSMNRQNNKSSTTNTVIESSHTYQEQHLPQVEYRQAFPHDKSPQLRQADHSREQQQQQVNLSDLKSEQNYESESVPAYEGAATSREDTNSHQQQQQQLTNTRRTNTRIVKRWNWNKQEFEVTEVPDVPSPRPAPQPAASLSRSSADVWHQEPDNSGSGSASALDFKQPDKEVASNSMNELMAAAGSPLNTITYEPSYLAYRVPDMDAVRGDPVYSDLMLGLQRLEEGVAAAKEPLPVSEPEVSSQRPMFGQAITPDYLEVNEYESAEFVCRLIPISDPDMKIEWTVNGNPLQESNRLMSEHEFGVARLRLKRCEAEDSGIYQCRASNSLGEAISTASLRVHAKGNIQCESQLNPVGLDKIRALDEPKAVAEREEEPTIQAPKFVSHIQDYVEKDEGESVHFECCLLPVDDPELKTEWFFNGRPLVTGSRFHTIDDFGFIVLDIDWLFPRDTGEYVCRARNAHGQDITRTVLRVRPAKNIILESQLDNPLIINKLHQLEFPDVAPEQPAVDEPDKPARFVEPLSSSGNQRQFVEGDCVHLEARVSPASDANLTVEWFHNGRPLISGHRFKPSFDFGHIQLDILYVYGEDSGVYRCVARNSSGEAASELELRVTPKPSLVYQSQLPKEMEGGVQKIEEMEAMWNRAPDPEEEAPPDQLEAPRFVLKLKPFTAFEGSCARFCCRIVGRPRPRLIWTLNGQTVVNGSRFKLTRDGMYHLTITKCLLSDAGKLEVHARNSLGEAYCSTELQVKRKLDDYRGVLKHSPRPWYDEQSLKVYQRSREQSDDDPPSDTSPGEWAGSAQAKIALDTNIGPAALRVGVQEETGQHHLIGYMEPDTPDVNLLAERRSPLLTPGDLHPVVLGKQVVMAPAPSTVRRAISIKDSVRTPEKSFKLSESFQERRRNARLANHHQQQQPEDDSFSQSHVTSSINVHGVISQETNSSDDTFLSQEKRDRLRVFGNEQNDETERRAHYELNQQSGHSRREMQQTRQDQHAEYLNRLRQQEASVAAAEEEELLRIHQAEQEHLYQQVRNEDEANQDYLSVKQAFDPRLPPQSPESKVHGKEVHSRLHKQTQKERRANREIIRQIIERDIFEQEHSGKSKENVVRGSSIERRSATPESVRSSPASQRLAMMEEQQQVTVYNEEHVIPPEFTLKIQPCQAVDGDEARFECAFTGDPQPTISWYRETKLIKPSNLYTIETDLQKNTSVLSIRRVAMNSNAVFTVKAENVAGSAKSSANLVVEPHPLPGVGKAGLARQVGNGVLDPAGALRGLSHYHEESPLARASSVCSSDGGEGASSSSARVVKSVRTRQVSGEEMSRLIRASPEGLIAPTFLHTIHDVQCKLGDLARLDARLIGSQPMDVRWLKDGERIRADRSHKMVLEGDLYTLLILECSQADEGTYECAASNSVGDAQCSSQLTVISDSENYRASSAGARTPDFLTSYSTSTSSVANYSTAAASTSSSQQQQSQSIPSTSKQQITSTTQDTLTTTESGEQRKYYGLTRHQYNPLMGQYTPSQALSAQQQQQQNYQIPKLIKKLENQQVKEGKSITLRCQISSYPIAQVFWYKQGDKLIKPSKYFRIFKDNDETYCLKILETFQEDQGEYKCVAFATNSPVQVETKAFVTVIPSSPK